MKYGLITALFLTLFTPILSIATPRPLTGAQERFVTQLVKQDHFNREKITQYLLDNQPNPSVIKHVKHPAEKRGWKHYKQIFTHPAFLDGGRAFYRLHQETLNDAYKRYGADPATIVALIGVETRYGKITGSYPAIQALNTLAFFHTRKPRYFRHELRALFILARNLKINPEKIHSSYAGALGIPQFMPSNYLTYGVSQRKQHPVDLFHNKKDAIYSVANFLKNKGWTKDAGSARRLKHNNPGNPRVITLGKDDAREYWEKLPNLKCIKRYNNSTHYAIAVTILANTIRDTHG